MFALLGLGLLVVASVVALGDKQPDVPSLDGGVDEFGAAQSADEVGEPPIRREALQSPVPGPDAGLADARDEANESPAELSHGGGEDPATIARRAVEADCLAFLREQWGRDDFVQWVMGARPVADMPEGWGMAYTDVELAHECATLAMNRAFVKHMSEVRYVEAEIASLEKQLLGDPDGLESFRHDLIEQDVAYSAFFGLLERLNGLLQTDKIVLRLLRTSGPDRTSKAVVLHVGYNKWRHYTTFTFQNGCWKVVFRVPDSSWPESDLEKIHDVYGISNKGEKR